MSHPDDEALVDLALGDESALTPDQRAHVSSCARCSATVAELRRTASLVGAAGEPNTWQSPPAAVWDRVESALDAATPLSAAPSARRRRGLVPWVAGAAAAGVAVGVVGGRTLWQDQAPQPQPVTVASARLATLDTSRPLGEAALVRTAEGVSLRVETQQLRAGEGYLEVWLINSDGRRMVSVGVFPGKGIESFPVSQELIDAGYTIVDISREGFDDRPEHSGDSVVRGRLDA